VAYQNDRIYLNRRFENELERGNQAANSSIAAIHYELAFRYALRCFEGSSEPPPLTLVPGHLPMAANPEVHPSAQAASLRERRAAHAGKAQA
jgi:hypothetical protein